MTPLVLIEVIELIWVLVYGFNKILCIILIGHLSYSIPSNTKDIILDKFLEKKITSSLSKVFDTNNLQYKEIKKNYNRLILWRFYETVLLVILLYGELTNV